MKFKIGVCQLRVTEDKATNLGHARTILQEAALLGARLLVLPLHLFDYYASKDDASFKESDSFAAGDGPTVIDTDVGRIGIGICHDIRFPELAMLYRAKGVDLIIYPGAFNMSTGEILWELETKARAVDNQVFVVVCSPSRDSAGSYTIWGHSMVVGSSGEVKASAKDEEKIVIAEIDYHENQLQRENFNLGHQRKPNIYAGKF